MDDVRTFLETRRLPTGTAAVAVDDALTLIASNPFFRLLIGEERMAASEAPSLRAFLVPESFTRLAADLREGGSVLEWSGLLRRQDGHSEVRLTAIRMEGVLHAGRFPVYLAAFMDMTRIGELYEEAELERRKFELIANISEDIPLEYDHVTDTLSYTERYREVFGLEPVIPRFRERLAAGEALDPISDGLRESFLRMDSETPEERAPELFLDTVSERPRWFALFHSTMHDAQGRPLRTVGLLRDIDRQKREQLRLLDKSCSDAMTGLYNKVTTEEEIRMALRDARPDSLGVLFMIDVDNFKRVNDHMGHLAGDSIIVEIARQLGRIFRQGDIIGRVGGDEFHVFMRDVREPASIRERAQSLCSSVRSLFMNSNLDNAVSISVGIAVTDKPIPYEDLFRQADVALYQAKGNGKNRYEFFGRTGRDGPGQPSSPMALNTVRNGIMMDIIDILFSAADSAGGIDRALEFIGNALRVDKIVIFEYSPDRLTVSLTQEWCADPAWNSGELFRNIPAGDLELARPTEPGGIYYCSDFSLLSPEEKAFLKDDSIRSLLQCDIVREGEVMGHIAFEERGGRRIWTQQEVDALILMSKILGEYIRQRHAAKLLRENSENTRSLLNALSSVAVYVVDSGCRLLYFNDTVRRVFPRARLGLTCHEVFRNTGIQCSFCPLLCGPGDSFSLILEDSPFHERSDMTVSRILWENREPAHALFVSRHIDSPDELREQENIRVALQNSYAKVYRINFAENRLTCLFCNEGQFVPIDETGQYDRDTHAFIREQIHPDDRAVFLNFSDPAYLTDRLAGGENSVIQYRKRGADGVYHWMEARVVALPRCPEEAVLLVRDVTELKERQNDYLMALQSNYLEIYRIDLQRDRITPAYYDSGHVSAPARFMPYAAFVRERLGWMIHPEHVEEVRAFYDAGAVAGRLAHGETSELEYRKRLDGSGPWLRVVASIRPVAGETGQALLLLRDVTELREEEAGFYNVLRRSYAEIYEVSLDADSVRTVYRENSPLLMPEPRPSYWETTRLIAEMCVHPDDRKAFLEQYAPESIRRGFGRDARVTVEYRLRATDGGWRWLSSLLLPLPATPGKFLILCRDVTERKEMERTALRLELRQSAVLRQSADALIEVSLNTWKYSRKATSSRLPVEPRSGDYRLFYRQALSMLVEEDAETFSRFFSPEALLEAGRSHNRDMVLRYCLNMEGTPLWLESRLSFLEEEEGLTAFIIVRDVSDQKRREEERAREEERLNLALRNTYDEIWELNVTRDDCRIVYHAPGKFVVPPERGRLSEVVGLLARDMIDPGDREAFLAFFDPAVVRRSFAEGRESLMVECRRLREDGSRRWASLTMFPAPRLEGGDEIHLVFVMDVEDRKRAEGIARQNAMLERRRLDDERYRAIVEQTDTLVFEWNTETGERYIAPALMRRFAGVYDEREILRVWVEDGVLHGEDLPLLNDFINGVRTRNYTEMTARFRTRENSFIWCKAALTCLYDTAGRPQRYIGTLNDVDDATRSVLALKYRAEFDLLTGIYNMHTFHAQTARLLRAAPDRRYSIIRLDVDRFKVLNDLYGIKEGDKLLVAMANLLRETLNGDGVCGRLGGDVFCVCVDYSRDRILDFIREITERLAEYPLPWKVVPSFGICEVDNLDTPINVLCDWANLALKTVKGSFLRRYAFYDDTLRQRILEEKNIENRMHEALLEGQFTLHLQPKVDIATSRIVGSEGLVRWERPGEGLLPPYKFIPLFERNGFIIHLDEYIWEQACILLRSWLDRGLEPCPISVNMSRMHIHDPKLREKLVEMVRRYDLPPGLLEFELTESAFLENEEELFEAMRTLRRYGFRFSMDDFGSGYSSLNMLKSVVVDCIKIDRGFLNEEGTTERGRTVIRFSIALAQEMDIPVIAEGVETEEQAAFLLEAGCSRAQGYFYSRPLPVPDFEALAFGTDSPFPVAPKIRAAAERMRDMRSGEERRSGS